MRSLVLLSLLVGMLAVVHDVSVPAGRGFAARAALAAIDSYRSHVSPHLEGFVTCRFVPTCSAYGREAIRKYGILAGGWRTVKRIARCNAWTPLGTIDRP
jgi:putative membrane protein insertion efficiency factor